VIVPAGVLTSAVASVSGDATLPVPCRLTNDGACEYRRFAMVE
jgi:hypothetical protein